MQRGYDVSLFLVHDVRFYKLDPRIKVQVLDNAPLFLHPLKKLLKLLPLAKRYAKLCDADISISFMNRPNYINVLSRYFGNKAKIIVSERGTPSAYYKGLEGAVSKALLRLLYPKANKVVANSKGNAQDLKSSFSIENVETIYNMFDLDQIQELAKEKVEDVDFDRFTFVSVGRLDENKNQLMQIEAMARSGLDAQLLLIGDGVMKEQLQARAKKLGIEHRVRFLGKRKNPYKYLARSDVFLLTSKSEGFPNVLVEAMAVGLPVIATDCPSGPAEILGNGKFGMLVALDESEALIEAMRKLYVDESLRQNYSTIAKIRAQDFSKDTIIHRWEDLLKGSV